MSLQIISDSVHGEPGTGFTKTGQGPSECANCTHFKDGNACDGKSMKKLSKQPRHPNGDVVVGPKDFCVYIDRIGKKGSGIAAAISGSRKNG